MSELANDELPKGWTAAILGSLGSVGSSKRVHQQDWKSEGVPFFRAREIAELSRSGSVDNDLFITQELFEELSKHGFVPSPGDLMITGVGTIGVPYVVKANDKFYFKDASVLIFKNDHGLEPRYLFFYLKSKNCQEWIKEGSTGTTVDTLTIARAREIPIPLAPLAEQKRIADKLESVLGRVDACRTRLDRVPDLLKRFRQSVLAAATSGQLTEDWRKTHAVSSVQESIDALGASAKTRRGVSDSVGAVPEPLALWECPSTWAKATAGQLISKGIFIDVKDGNHGSNHPKVSEFTSDGLPFITAAQVRDFRIDYDDAYKIKGEPLSKLRVGFAKADDVILTHKGTVGRVAFADRDCILTPQTTYYRVNPEWLEPKYLMYFLASPAFGNQLDEIKSQTTRDFVPISQQYSLGHLIPTRSEQTEIVRRVEALFALADRIEARLAAAQRLVERLSPATLSKAFRGDLVPQDPNDEPASKLLERLKAGPTPAVTPRRAPVQPVQAKPEPRPALQEPAAPKAAQKADRSVRAPIANRQPIPIDDTQRHDVLALIREVFATGGARDRDTALKEIATALGYERLGPHIREVLSTDIRTAVRRGILHNQGGSLTLLCRSIEDYERDFLKELFLAAISQNGRVWLERDDAIRLFTRWLGFRRTGATIDETARSLINGLLRDGSLEKDGQDWIRRV